MQTSTSPDSLDESQTFYLAFKEYLIEHALKGLNADNDKDFVELDDYYKEKFKSYALYKLEEDRRRFLADIIFKDDSFLFEKLVNCHFIHFPKADAQSEFNFLNLLKKCRNINFDNCHFYGNRLYTNLRASFQDCIFENEFYLDRFSPTQLTNSVFSSCDFKKKVLSSGEQGFLQYSYFDSYCIFYDGLTLKNLKIISNIFYQDGHPEDSASKPRLTLEGDFLFEECIFEKDQEIFISGASKANFIFDSCEIHQKLKIRGLEYKKGYEYQQNNKSNLKSLKISSCRIADAEKSYLRIGFLKNCEFILQNLKNQVSSELNIGDCHFTSFQLTNFRNLGKFKLFKINILQPEFDSSITHNAKFKIDNTSIGRADLQSINLISFDEVFFFDNIFAEVDYTNVEWKNDILVGQYNDDQLFKLAKKRDSYRTLKNVALRNNDHPQALIFHAEEMENHYELTSWKKEFTNKLTLLFNKVTNKFGMSWWRPTWLLLSIAMLFYLELLKSTGGICIFDNFVANYWVFLNPTHKVEFVAKDCWTGWTYLVDLSFRIIEGLFIYQIIQGLRKFTRKV
jgi:hypothetical protein